MPRRRPEASRVLPVPPGPVKVAKASVLEQVEHLRELVSRPRNGVAGTGKFVR